LASSEETRGAGFRKELSRFDATMVVVGGIIGAGIFINPYIVAQRLDSVTLVLGAWLAGGMIAVAGAFTFAELGTLFPQAGGHYAYLRRAYHPIAGFLYGWGLLLMIEGGAIAAVAITFAEYFLRALGRATTGGTSLAVFAVAIVALVNYLGVKPGSRVLNAFVMLKIFAIAALVVAGLIVAPPAGTESVGVTGAASGGASGIAALGPFGLLVAFGGALIPIMFTYGGWQNANYVAEEMKDARRDLPRSLIIGTLIVVVVYGFINFVYLRTLGHGGLASTLTPASDTARIVFGPAGDRIIAGAIAVSTFGFLNLTMLAPTRVYYAMARDGVFMESVARIHPRFGTPSLAIVIQSVWAIALVLTGTYAQLVDYVVFADWIFFGLAGLSLFIFRRRFPVDERDAGVFRTPGYPFVPGLFVLVALLIIASVLWTNPRGSSIGLGILVLGVPAYLFWQRRSTETERRGGHGMKREIVRAPYMHWAKHHPHATHDLMGSNLLPVPLEELPGARQAVRLSGPNDDGYAPLVEAIAARYGVTPDRVCTAPGTSGANFIAMAAILRPGDEVLIESPAYDPFLGIADMLGARVRRFERRFENRFVPDPADVAAAVTDQTRLVVLSNLHNPTGALTPEPVLADIGEHAAAVGARVLVDEVYRETAFEEDTRPAVCISSTFVSTNSLTKAWGLSGLRCGWALGEADVAEMMRRARDAVDAVGSFPSDAIAVVAFDEMDRLEERSRRILLRNSRALAEVLEDAARDEIVEWVRPPAGASIAFPRLVGTDDAARFVKWVLDEYGIGVVPGRFFGRPNHVRVAVGGDPAAVGPALDRLSDALRAWSERA